MFDANTVITLLGILLSTSVTLVTLVWKLADTRREIESRLIKLETEFQCYLGKGEK